MTLLSVCEAATHSPPDHLTPVAAGRTVREHQERSGSITHHYSAADGALPRETTTDWGWTGAPSLEVNEEKQPLVRFWKKSTHPLSSIMVSYIS